MKEFLKDNIALVAAIVLPLTLAVIFALSTLFANVSVEDPKNDFLIVSDYDSSYTGFEFNVVGDKLNVSFKAPQKDASGNIVQYTAKPRLWRVHVPEMSVEEIGLQNPNGNAATASIPIKGVTDVKVQNITPGPDGYTFVNSYSNGGNLMTEIFSADHSSGDYKTALFKGGRYVPIKMPDGNNYYYNTRFLGWIVSEEAK